jgi:hypothetical protein
MMSLTVSVYRQDRAPGGLAPKAARTGADFTMEAADGELGVGQELTEAATRAGRELLAGLGVVASDYVTVDVEPLEARTGRVDLTGTLEPALAELEALEQALADGHDGARRAKTDTDVAAVYRETVVKAATLAARLRRELVAAGAGGGPGHPPTFTTPADRGEADR